jgi:hypothetical protein
MSFKIVIGSESFNDSIESINAAKTRLAELNPKISVLDAEFYLFDGVEDDDDVLLQRIEKMEKEGTDVATDVYIQMYLREYAKKDIVFSANENLVPHEFNPENMWVTRITEKQFDIIKDPAEDPTHCSIAAFDRTFPDGVPANLLQYQ